MIPCFTAEICIQWPIAGQNLFWNLTISNKHRKLLKTLRSIWGVMPSVQVSSVLPGRREEVFDFLFREEAWDRGIPPCFESELLQSGPLREKTILRWRLTRFGVSFDWAVKIDSVKSNEKIVVSQNVGLFEEWILTQELLEHGDNSTKIKDTVEYRLPLGIIGAVLDDVYVRREIKNLLESRHEKILELLQNRKVKSS